MDTQELQNSIQQLTEQVSKISGDFDTLNKNYNNLKTLFEHHAHSGSDSTMKLKYGLEIQQSEISYFGNGGILQINNPATPTVDTFFIASGKDRGLPAGNAQSTINSTIQLQNQTNDSFFYGVGHEWTNANITVTAAGATLTDATFNWTVNALAGMYVNILTSDSLLVETQKIASNTASVITITGTWANTTSGAIYEVFTPCYLGSAQHPWRRVYTGEGTGEGIRFGYGVTNGGQNGLLYMDATGDIYWRDKASIATKLNNGGGGGSSITGRSGGSGVTTISTATYTKVTLTNTIASGITWDNTNKRFTVLTAGKYVVTGQVAWGTVTNGQQYYTIIYKNGSLNSYGFFASTGTPEACTVTDLLDLSVSDYIELYVYQASGGNQTIQNDAQITFLTIAAV